ncbi:class I SAM-dependent methyltransferase [Pseudonocardia phyllosphaerae]|uniref:class I SAM-dependent methyltransferase n=1 Tax=Pseudonocardia phyllosphaerae TaxID=3390502 RepID=UPI00397B55DB
MTTPNPQQRAAWSGRSGDHWAAHPDRYEAGVAEYRDALAAAADVRPGEQVLDVGCGFGTTTIDAARAAGPDGHALGVDLSPQLLELARERAAAAGVPATFALADAQTDRFGPVDLVLSRNGVMFFDDPAAAFANLRRALRPGGRIVLQVWQSWERQEWLHAVHEALGLPAAAPEGPSPVSLGDPDRIRALLTGAGFTDIVVDGLARPMWLGADVDDAAQYQLSRVGPDLAERTGEQRDAAVAALRESLAAHLGPDGVVYDSAVWLVRGRST